MRFILSLAMALAALSFTFPAVAAERIQPFSPEAFAAAQEAGKPILIDVWAPWCPVCRRQSDVVNEALEDEQFNDLVVLKVSYDKQKKVVREFRAPRQSTLIAFRGETETGRAIAITDEAEIEALMLSAYAK